MNLHEYQAKEHLRNRGVPITNCFVVSSVKEAEEILERESLSKAVVKVQVHAGGRGKAGGVKFCSSKEEILQTVKEYLGKRIVTKQTGAEGLVSHKVLIDLAVDIEKEYYLSAVIDRATATAMLVGSPEGGMDIEEVAENHPEKIISIPIELDGSIRGYHLIAFCKVMGWDFSPKGQAIALIRSIAKAFMDADASLLEINPLVRTKSGDLVAIDTKLAIDDNALYRQKELAKFYDPTQQHEAEVKAFEHDLAYVAMDGSIGCMVNGAGLAMSTMDIIHHYGASPANFLDVGGSATVEKVTTGFKIILSDPKVKGILVNIFGGIMSCRVIAEGVIQASKEVGIEVPLVVRLEGTDVEEGRKLLADSGLTILVAESLSDAAQKITEATHVNIGK